MYVAFFERVEDRLAWAWKLGFISLYVSYLWHSLNDSSTRTEF